MDDYDFAVIFLYCISFLSSVVQGITGFGDAITLHLLWNVGVHLYPGFHGTILGSSDVELIALLLSLRSTICQAVLWAINREAFHKELFKCLCPIQCVTIVVGAVLLHFMSDEVLKPILGVAFLVAAFLFCVTKLHGFIAVRCGGRRSSSPLFSLTQHKTEQQPEGAFLDLKVEVTPAAVEACQLPLQTLRQHQRSKVPLSTESEQEDHQQQHGTECVVGAGTTTQVSVAKTDTVLITIDAPPPATEEEKEEEASTTTAPSSEPTSETQQRQTSLQLSTLGDGKLHPIVRWSAVTTGAIAGLGEGISGVGGPPLMLFVLWFQLPVQLVRSTVPISSCFAGIVRILFSQSAGLYNWNAWLCYVNVIVGGLVGLSVGDYIGRSISDAVYTVFVTSLLLLACMTMLNAPLPAIGVVIVVAFVVAFVVAYRERKVAASLPSASDASFAAATSDERSSPVSALATPANSGSSTPKGLQYQGGSKSWASISYDSLSSTGGVSSVEDLCPQPMSPTTSSSSSSSDVKAERELSGMNSPSGVEEGHCNATTTASSSPEN